MVVCKMSCKKEIKLFHKLAVVQSPCLLVSLVDAYFMLDVQCLALGEFLI